MSLIRLLKHKDYEASARHLPKSIQRKALWAQVLLGTRGRTPNVKGVTGLNERWRRTPVQGNHYYMWWIPSSESGLVDEPQGLDSSNAILVHSIRHHDETDDPIDLGSFNDYEEIAVANLDPRFEEQTYISTAVQGDQVALATIKGLPGSGKTVSLLYLVRDLALNPNLNRVLYVTYTSRLQRAAREFLQAQDERIGRTVDVYTLGEIEQMLTGLPAQREPFGELPSFIRFLGLQNAATLGPWKKYPQTLFTEIRAHLLGKTFPADYLIPAARFEELTVHGAGLNPVAYSQNRQLDREAAEIACQLAERAENALFFQDQKAARRAIERLQKGKSPSWVAELDALVIDEVQDLTLVQIALLGELVRERVRRRPDAPLVFVVAGDESQIVQPSGFDWGITKDLLGEQVGIWPEEFEFHYQRRSPPNLAQLIDNTWNLYAHLPRSLRPSARRQAFAYDTLIPERNGLPPIAVDDEGYGQIFLCPLPAGSETGQRVAWQTLLTELTDKPGRVVVDLSDTLRATLGDAVEIGSDEVIFLPREIKGLERATVLIFGLNTLYERGLRLCEGMDGGNIAKFEARRLFDEIRVALSRSTDRLVILDAPSVPVYTALGLDKTPGVLPIRWEELLETLQNEQMSTLEVIEGYLDEVDDLFERHMWEQGYRRNRRAHDLAVQLGDAALCRETAEQYIVGHLQETNELLSRAALTEALMCNRQAHLLATDLGDPLLQDEVDDQHVEIAHRLADQVRQQVDQARQQILQRQFKQAHQQIQNARSTAALIEDNQLLADVDELFVAVIWQWAGELLTKEDAEAQIPHLVTLFEEAAKILEQQADTVGAQALRLLAKRYRHLPRRQLNPTQISDLLGLVKQYLELVKPLDVAEDAYLFICLWLDEIFASLESQTDLYYAWVHTAQTVATITEYPIFDEHLWDLENRVEQLLAEEKREQSDPALTRFRAFASAYNDDPQQASLLWEQLGETDLAISAAREAGDLERSYQLIRQARLAIPEDLATAVKTLRLLQQLTQKHHSLQQAERNTLIATMTHLQRLLEQGETASKSDDANAVA